MEYFRARWSHDYPEHAVLFYSELDADGWETRKVEVWVDGTKRWAAPGVP
ncbi:hypothetical protein JOD54_004423 [Actinokineospora baliensis]|nr:hypothetical protein [Actinokineospora baliensis]MBM7774219.1 hypothetical protein [Actinokineospora baliensis]